MSEPEVIAKARRVIEQWRVEMPYLVQPESWTGGMIALLDAYDAMKQRAEAAEAELQQAHDEVKMRWAWADEQEARAIAAEAERDALRTVDDAMVERAWKAIADVCGVVCYNDDGEYMPRHHINLVEREDVRDCLTAALAVQPTTGEAK